MYRLILVVIILICGIASDSVSQVKVLFVGNSLTYVNDLPGKVKALAKQDDLQIVTDQLTFPNYALEDHWMDGKLQDKIASGKFDFIIVQQGPSSQADGRSMLLEYGMKIQELCRKHQTQLIFYMVWPARSNYHTFSGVVANYTEAADKTGAILCPVGKAYRELADKSRNFSWYGPDNFHPSESGTQLAAELLLESILENR